MNVKDMIGKNRNRINDAIKMSKTFGNGTKFENSD